MYDDKESIFTPTPDASLERAGGALDGHLDAVPAQLCHHVDLLNLPSRAREQVVPVLDDDVGQPQLQILAHHPLLHRLPPRDHRVDALLRQQVGADVHQARERGIQELVLVHRGLGHRHRHDRVERLQQRVRLELLQRKRHPRGPPPLRRRDVEHLDVHLVAHAQDVARVRHPGPRELGDVDESLQPGRLGIVLRELHKGAKVGEGDNLRGCSDAGLEPFDTALLDQRALGDDDLLVGNVGDLHLDDLTHLRLERGDGGVLGGGLLWLGGDERGDVQIFVVVVEGRERRGDGLWRVLLPAALDVEGPG
mmetsp:Transcript_1513/g.5727  ORF Transcript_1513/g.5727 Transcript_1513/m.5727 type:complete len:308 (-) Transcript_1513:482-1405(-)